MGKTYLVGKIGKSVKFNPNTWGPIGGDNETKNINNFYKGIIYETLLYIQNNQ